MKVIAIAAGGTSGHIQPAITTAQQIKESKKEVEVFFIGTSKGLEQEIIPAKGFELNLIPAVPLPRSINLRTLFFPFSLISAVSIARKILKNKDVDCVIGFGAYISMPVYLAAFIEKIPIIIHEGNRKAGFANKFGALFTKHIFQMFSGSLKNAKTIGMPVRKELIDLDRSILKSTALSFFDLAKDKKTLFIFGGSQGASKINDLIYELIPNLVKNNIQILHSIGKRNQLRDDLKSIEMYHPISYIEKMEYAYAAADLVISRAGAMTIAEQTVAGIPAIYIPFAVGNGEQIHNVKDLISADAGVLIEEKELNKDKLEKLIISLISDDSKLQKMSNNAKSFAQTNAAQILADKAIELVK